MSFSLEELKKKTSCRSVTPNGSSGLATLKNNLAKGDLNSRINSLAAQALPQAGSLLKSKSVELVFLLDRSLSCDDLVQSTIQGFNNLIDKEKKRGYPTIVSTILFNDKDKVVHDRLDIDSVQGLDYSAAGGTALYDALCKNLYRIQMQQKTSMYIPTKTVAIIMTDGEDFDSHMSTLGDAQNVISSCKALGWEFIFLGANLDIKKVAATLGIDSSQTANYSTTSDGVLLTFEAVEKALHSLREEGAINPNWSESIHKYNLEQAHNDQGPVLRLGGRK